MLMEVEAVNRMFQSGSETVQALRNVDILVEKGALTVLRGRSGSGKTTLMNILGALDKPQSGRVLFEDTDLTRLSEARRDRFRRKNVGFVFQSVALISQMSAYENVEFGLRVAHIPAKHRKARAEECLSFVGLSKRMQHRPQELSGGEQQRVAIARAIAHRPKIVFADEPTAELDSHMGLQVIKLFRDLVEKEGLTILMTTHDPNMMELADHVYTLEDGAIVEELHNLQMVQRPDLVLNASFDVRIPKKETDPYSAAMYTDNYSEAAITEPEFESEYEDEYENVYEEVYDTDSYITDENENNGASPVYDYDTDADESRREKGYYATRYVDESSIESVYGDISAPKTANSYVDEQLSKNDGTSWRKNKNSLFSRQTNEDDIGYSSGMEDDEK